MAITPAALKRIMEQDYEPLAKELEVEITAHLKKYYNPDFRVKYTPPINTVKYPLAVREIVRLRFIAAGWLVVAKDDQRDDTWWEMSVPVGNFGANER